MSSHMAFFPMNQNMLKEQQEKSPLNELQAICTGSLTVHTRKVGAVKSDIKPTVYKTQHLTLNYNVKVYHGTIYCTNLTHSLQQILLGNFVSVIFVFDFRLMKNLRLTVTLA